MCVLIFLLNTVKRKEKMFVRIKSAPKSMDMRKLVHVAVVHTAKAISVIDPEQFILEISGGDDDDIKKLKAVAGITVERVKQREK